MKGHTKSLFSDLAGFVGQPHFALNVSDKGIRFTVSNCRCTHSLFVFFVYYLLFSILESKNYTLNGNMSFRTRRKLTVSD